MAKKFGRLSFIPGIFAVLHLGCTSVEKQQNQTAENQAMENQSRNVAQVFDPRTQNVQILGLNISVPISLGKISEQRDMVVYRSFLRGDSSQPQNPSNAVCTVDTQISSSRFGSPSVYSLRPQSVIAEFRPATVTFAENETGLLYQIKCMVSSENGLSAVRPTPELLRYLSKGSISQSTESVEPIVSPK